MNEDHRHEIRKAIGRNPFNAYAEAFSDRWSLMLAQIPERMREAIVSYILLGDRRGDFLHAVLSNNLIEAFTRADDVNRKKLLQFCVFLNNAAPPDCFGSREIVEAWIEKGGVVGLLAQEETDNALPR